MSANVYNHSSNVHDNTTEAAIDAASSDAKGENGTNSGQAPQQLGPQNGSRMSRTHAAQVLGYVPAEAHFAESLTYVDLYAVHPVSGVLTRKRYKLNRIKSAVARKQAARDLCAKLNARLRAGWVPWGASEAPKSMFTIKDVLNTWVEVKKRLRFSSPHNYLMQARLFQEWCCKQGLFESPIGMFTRRHAQAYMDHLETTRKLKNVTYNGYLNIICGFFRWAVRREYRSDNPFEKIERKRKGKKLRTIIWSSERREALAWFAEHDPVMVPICLLVFHALVRPRNELARLRVEHLDFEEGVLRFPAELTKTDSERHPALPAHMIEMLRSYPIATADPRHYVVGEGLRPGPKPMNLNEPARRWTKMRKALGWPSDKQLMSLRDSGIVQLIVDKVPLTSVMKQADHKHISTTNAYVQHAFPYAQDDVRRLASPM